MTVKTQCPRILSQNISTTAILIIAIVLILILSRSPYMTKVMAAEGIALGIYWDRDCTSSVSAISWGILAPGVFKEVKVYLRNEGDAAFCLYLSTTNWDPPEASEYIILSWNYDGQTLIPNQVLQVALKLSLSQSIEGITTFSFDILIDSEEVPLQPSEQPSPPKVDITPPKISITSPRPVEVIAGSSLVLRWVGWDSESGINYYSVYLYGEFIANTEDTSYEIQSLVEGVNNVTIIAFDKAGNRGAAKITIIVDNKAPAASLMCPEGDKVKGTVTLRLNVSDENLAKTMLYIDESEIDVTGEDSYELRTRDLDDGYHAIRIVATDKAGNTNSSSISLMVDNSDPVLSIISPSEDAVVSGSLTLRLIIFDINLVNMVYRFDGKPINTTSIVGETAYEIDTTKLEDGPHIIDLAAIDAVGNSIEKRIRINVDNTPPILDIKVPANGSYIKGVVSINLVCDDANFERANLYISGNLTKRWHMSGTQMFNWNTKNHEDGIYTIKALTTDKAGNTIEKTLMVSVDNTVPDLSITSPREGAKLAGTRTIRFAVSDKNLAKVLLYIDDSVFDVTGVNSYQWYTANLNDGIHRIRIVATDETGNINEAQITVTTINQYLIVETMVGLVICAFLIVIWPLIPSSKVPIV